MEEAKQTPLFQEHVKLGARMIPFAGWLMPVHYPAPGGMKEEHLNVRKNLGLFDVSHMGEIRVQGPKALLSLEWLTSNEVKKLKKGDAQYSLLTNEEGGIVDDIIIYCIEPEEDYLICVNAANLAKDLAWILKHNLGADVRDESEEWGQIAVQGPRAMELISLVLGESSLGIKKFNFAFLPFRNEKLIFARTGYTGEDGGELFVPAHLTKALWEELLLKGEPFGVMPIGLGARDSLRLEMGYSLYGHEITDETNPIAAGLGWVVKADKKDFIGKAAILEKKRQGFKEVLRGFKMLERGIPRQGYALVSAAGDENLGTVASGTLSPITNEFIGTAWVRADKGEIGSRIWVLIRDKKVPAEICQMPFIPLQQQSLKQKS